MNIFIAIMLVFAAAGLVDEMLGGKLGLMPNFEKGLATMGGLAMSTVGFFAIGVTYVQTHAEAIAEAAKHMPFDPALIPSCLLAPDMGALGMAQKLAATPALAAFTGAMVAGSLGMTVGYQLPRADAGVHLRSDCHTVWSGGRRSDAGSACPSALF